MSIEIIDVLKPKNEGNFPIVEAIDVWVEGFDNLADAVSHFATDTMITAINVVLSGKANTSDVNTAVTNLQGQIDQIEISATAEAVVAPEVAGARVNSEGISFTTLKARCDADYVEHTNAENAIKETIGTISESLGEETTTTALSLTWTSGYMTTNGTTAASDSLHYSNEISVQEGNVIESDYFFRFVTAFDKYGVAVPEKGDSTATNKTYTVPSGVAKIVITENTGHAENITCTETREAITAKDDTARNQIQNVSNTVTDVTEVLGSQTTIETLTLTWTAGYMSTNGTVETSETLHYSSEINVQEGNIITSDHLIRFVTAFNANNEAVSEAGDSSGENKSYTVPSGIVKIVISERSDSASTIEKSITRIVTTANDITARGQIENVADLIGAELVTYRKTTPLNLSWTSGYMGVNGSTASSDSLHYSNKIDVKEGDVIDSTYIFRFVTAFDENNEAVAAKGDNTGNNKSYTVPSGIVKVVITEYTGHDETITHTFNTTEYIIDKTLNNFRAAGDMASGDSLTLPIQNINHKTVEAFSGEISTFSSIEIGRGEGGGNGYYIEIDDTNITIHKDATASEPIPHGLTIENDIQVKITSDTDGNTNPQNYFKATFRITSNGQSFETSENRWLTHLSDAPFVKSVGSTLHDCSFSFQSLDTNKPTYAFGDSYFSWYPERWTYYLALDGYSNNVLTNAYAGQNTPSALQSFGNIINIGEPKYILWCLGMNDGSDTTEPSKTWKTGVDIVVSTCKEYGITPILATIPTVPSINHENKNQWIRNSGYRYVDFAKAVGATSEGVWYTGMLDDGVHPTAEGAKALYNRLLTDFPEIMAE